MGCYTQLGIADSLDNPNPLKMKTLKGWRWNTVA